MAKIIRADLEKEGWPDPLVGDSGNGGHLVYPLDLPNGEESTALLKAVLAGLARRLRRPVGPPEPRARSGGLQPGPAHKTIWHDGSEGGQHRGPTPPAGQDYFPARSPAASSPLISWEKIADEADSERCFQDTSPWADEWPLRSQGIPPQLQRGSPTGEGPRWRATLLLANVCLRCVP